MRILIISNVSLTAGDGGRLAGAVRVYFVAKLLHHAVLLFKKPDPVPSAAVLCLCMCASVCVCVCLCMCASVCVRE